MLLVGWCLYHLYSVHFSSLLPGVFWVSLSSRVEGPLDPFMFIDRTKIEYDRAHVSFSSRFRGI